MDLSGRSVLLTGATGGIGHAIARALHGRGARLVLTGRRTDVLEPLAAELGATAIAADLDDRSAVARLTADHLDVDVLIANAALPADGPLTGFSSEEIDAALDVNLRAPITMAHALATAMTERGHGHLVFISSLSGKVAAPGSSMYSATKFGLRGFALGLREDLRGTGVGVTTIFPGFISDAGMFAQTGVELPRGVGTKTPEQVAAAVVKGIEKNRAEVDVAPVGMRLSAIAAGIAPETIGRISQKLGAAEISAQVHAGHLDKRR